MAFFVFLYHLEELRLNPEVAGALELSGMAVLDSGGATELDVGSTEELGSKIGTQVSSSEFVIPASQIFQQISSLFSKPPLHWLQATVE